MKLLLGRIAGMLCALAAGCTLIVSGCAMDGRVVDSETGAPIQGALVIAEWTGDIGGPVQSSQVCFHLEVATTDSEGRYHIPSWSRRPVADYEGGFFGLRNVEVTRRTYKAGYVHVKYDEKEPNTILMSHFHGTSEQRIDYLSLEGTRSCGKRDGSRSNEIGLWRAICEEARKYPEAARARPKQDESFLRQIDTHLAYLLQDPDEGRPAHDDVVPRICS
jgi:hypothetical protein